MNKEYVRITSLLEQVGIACSEEGFSAAEAAAYAKGLSLVRALLEAAETAVFFYNSSDNTLEEYAQMLGLDSRRFTREELINTIFSRMAERFTYLSTAELEEGFARIGSGIYSIDGATVVFDQIQPDDLPALGRFIAGYLPIVMGTRYNGSGMCFDDWDSTGLSFTQYDALKLPFELLDTLRSDYFEQHI